MLRLVDLLVLLSIAYMQTSNSAVRTDISIRPCVYRRAAFIGRRLLHCLIAIQLLFRDAIHRLLRREHVPLVIEAAASVHGRTGDGVHCLEGLPRLVVPELSQQLSALSLSEALSHHNYLLRILKRHLDGSAFLLREDSCRSRRYYCRVEHISMQVAALERRVVLRDVAKFNSVASHLAALIATGVNLVTFVVRKPVR